MALALAAAGRVRAGVVPAVDEVAEVAGQGVSGRVEGHRVDVGSVAYVAAGGAGRQALDEARTAAGAQRAAIAALTVDGRAAALAIFTDPLRPAVPALLRRLRELGVRETVMLAGDDEARARAVAAEAGISTVKANLLTAHKAEGCASCWDGTARW